MPSRFKKGILDVLAHMGKLIMILLGLSVVSFLIASSAYLQDMVNQIISGFGRFAESDPLTSRLAFLALAAASVLVGPFSSAPLVPLAISSWGTIETSIMLFLGWILGDTLAYALGKYAGKPSVALLVGYERLDHWISVLRPRMKFSLLLLFRFATPAETGYIFGLLSYDFAKYLLITVLAEAPLVFLVISAGDAFLLGHWGTFGILLVAGLLAIFLVYRLFVRRFKAASLEPKNPLD